VDENEEKAYLQYISRIHKKQAILINVSQISHLLDVYEQQLITKVKDVPKVVDGQHTEVPAYAVPNKEALNKTIEQGCDSLDTLKEITEDELERPRPYVQFNQCQEVNNQTKIVEFKLKNLTEQYAEIKTVERMAFIQEGGPFDIFVENRGINTYVEVVRKTRKDVQKLLGFMMQYTQQMN